MISVSINEQPFEFADEITVLEAAKTHGIKIPTLCHNDLLLPYGGCRVCLVEVVGRRGLMPACSTTIADGMVVNTESEKVLQARKFIVTLLLSRCPETEAIQRLAKEFGVPYDEPAKLDTVERYLLQRAPKREETNCILCNLCVRVCAEVPQRHALSISSRGIQRRVRPPFEKAAETCIGCGSCAYVCPTKTITITEVS